MIQLLSKTEMVITDSGGLQKEAYFFGRHCITLRDQMEWTELIDHGVNTLLSPTEEDLFAVVEKMIGKPLIQAEELYGGGKAGDRIAASLAHYLS